MKYFKITGPDPITTVVFLVSVMVSIIFLVIQMFINRQEGITCPPGNTLFTLSHNPVYYGLQATFTSQPDNSSYTFQTSRINLHENHQWQCRYYDDNKNSPILVMFPDPDNIIPANNHWISHDNQYVCDDDSIDDCKVRVLENRIRDQKNGIYSKRRPYA